MKKILGLMLAISITAMAFTTASEKTHVDQISRASDFNLMTSFSLVSQIRGHHDDQCHQRAKEEITKGEKPSKSVTELLKYYKENYEVLSKINMVYNYNGNKPGTSSSKEVNTNYSVDFKGTEKYLTGIKKSGFVGPKFIDKLRAHFLKCEKDFKDNPQNSGIPRGFENDFLMLDDEFMNDLNNLQKIEIMDEAIRSNSSATVKIKFPSGNVRVYDLAKQSDVWLVNEIII